MGMCEKEVAILCPGPSLAGIGKSDVDGKYDVVVTVNKACEKFDSDYLVCVEKYATVLWDVKSKPILVTQPVVPCWLLIKRPQDIEKLSGFWIDFPYVEHKDYEYPWWTQSGTFAVAFAGAPNCLAADRIDVFGMDMKGTEYFDGTDMGRLGSRSVSKFKNRWELERRAMDDLCRYFEMRGVEIWRYS